MPTYDYRCKSCELIFEKLTSISKGHDPQECPQCKSMDSERFYGVGAPSLGDPVRLGIRRPDGGFKEVLQRIHERTPGSVLKDNSRYL